MSRNPKKVSPTGSWALVTVLLNTIVLRSGVTDSSNWYWALPLTIPLMWMALVHLAREHTPLEKDK